MRHVVLPEREAPGPVAAVGPRAAQRAPRLLGVGEGPVGAAARRQQHAVCGQGRSGELRDAAAPGRSERLTRQGGDVDHQRRLVHRLPVHQRVGQHQPPLHVRVLDLRTSGRPVIEARARTDVVLYVQRQL